MPPIWRGSNQLIEQGDSGTLHFGESIIYTRKWSGPYALCVTSAPPRGSIGLGPVAGLRVKESLVERARAGIGVLVVTYEAGSVLNLPPESIKVTLEQLERPIQKHPRYASLADEIHSDINTALNTPRTDHDHIVALTVLQDTSPLGLELYRKLKRGFTHYILFTPVIVLETFHPGPPNLSAGGYVEQPPISATSLLAQGTVWLREGDQSELRDGLWALRRTWRGAPDWDGHIYQR